MASRESVEASRREWQASRESVEVRRKSLEVRRKSVETRKPVEISRSQHFAFVKIAHPPAFGACFTGCHTLHQASHQLSSVYILPVVLSGKHPKV